MSPNQLSQHLQIDRYADFWLTNAIRPSMQGQVIPQEGYRKELYHDEAKGIRVPVLASAISREQLFDAFLDLLEPLGEVVDVILESSHDFQDATHRDLMREGIDLPVLQSHLCDFEELLLHDGCTGIAVLSKEAPIEIQFDEHKLLVVYAKNLRPFEAILQSYDIPHRSDLKLISEGEHLHNTNANHAEQFEQLCLRMGIGSALEHANW